MAFIVNTGDGEATTSVPSPLFTHDFGSNGGVLAPRSFDALLDWINTEDMFWQWSQRAGGTGPEPIRRGLELLQRARVSALQASEMSPDDESYRTRLDSVRTLLDRAYRVEGLPHSSSTLGKRIHEMQIGSPNRAIGYLFTQMPRSGARFDGHQVESFAGLIEGLFENRILAEVPDLALRAALASADGLKVKLEHLLAEKTAAYDELQRKYADLAKTINEQASSQVEDHRKQSETFEGLFNTRLVDHETTMAGIQRTFNEGMKLRGPVGYWKSRRTLHTWLAVVFGIASFGAIAGLGYSVWTLAHELFGRLKTGENPSSWQLASLILFAVFGAWAGRLIVRLFLSNSHLATDAAERVVMTQTYLALVEESKLSDEKDRSLVLASLFRPGSDGIVKEESIPHPALDLLTRFGGKP